MPTRTVPLVSLNGTGLAFIPEKELSAAGWELRLVTSLPDAKALLRTGGFHTGLVVFPREMSPSLEAIEEVLLEDKGVEWLALIDPLTLNSREVAKFVKEMFFDYLSIPVDPFRLRIILGHAFGKGALYPWNSEGDFAAEARLLGESPAIRTLHEQILKVRSDDAPVLITGESGTGKELAARRIHTLSSRRRAPFVAVNCAAIPATLVQSELFGFERGAFTGAVRRKIGRIESAAGGTILLDEIGDLPLQIQVHLLRFLQEKCIERVGATRSFRVDVRVIAATNIDLEAALTQNRFREDLYYRLNVLRIHIPPLRERGNDIELLARAFLEQHAQKLGRRVKRFSRQAVRALYDHSWPGNVRELGNRVRRAAVVSEGAVITAADLGLVDPDLAPPPPSLDQVREQAELQAIRQSLRRNMNNVSDSARELGVSRVTLYRLINKLQLAHELR